MRNIMPIDNILDWEKRIARHDAFWDCEIIDRPVVLMSFQKKKPVVPLPKQKIYSSIREKWMDAEYIAECAFANAMNTEFLGDALPSIWPNLGPDVFAAFLGCELEFAETTSWSSPILDDYAKIDSLRFSEDNFYYRKICEMTDILLEKGRNKFYVGYTDFHPGGDAIAALRGSAKLNYDLMEHPDDVKQLRRKIDQLYFQAVDLACDRLQKAAQPCFTSSDIISTKKWALVCNDFSCMISKQMFDDVFLPGIVSECKHFEKSLYHLDGPGAMQHLDSLFDIKELDVIQWIRGDGHGRASDWMHIYKRIQQAGKGMQIWPEVDEIDFFMENLRPEGLWLAIDGVKDVEIAKRVVAKISRWK